LLHPAVQACLSAGCISSRRSGVALPAVATDDPAVLVPILASKTESASARTHALLIACPVSALLTCAATAFVEELHVRACGDVALLLELIGFTTACGWLGTHLDVAMQPAL
jgi:hypothetical protein